LLRFCQFFTFYCKERKSTETTKAGGLPIFNDPAQGRIKSKEKETVSSVVLLFCSVDNSLIFATLSTKEKEKLWKHQQKLRGLLAYIIENHLSHRGRDHHRVNRLQSTSLGAARKRVKSKNIKHFLSSAKKSSLGLMDQYPVRMIPSPMSKISIFNESEDDKETL